MNSSLFFGISNLCDPVKLFNILFRINFLQFLDDKSALSLFLSNHFFRNNLCKYKLKLACNISDVINCQAIICKVKSISSASEIEKVFN